MADQSFDSNDSEGSELSLPRAFWAIELTPNKEYTTEVPFELHITSAVLPASAKSTDRSVVSVSFDEEEDKKTFSLVSLKLGHNESQLLNTRIDEESKVTFTVSGHNSVHLSGYYVPSAEDEMGPGMFDDDDEDIDSDEAGDEFEMEDEDSELSDDSKGAAAKVTAALKAQQEKRKGAPGQPNGEATKKAKTDAPAAQQQKQGGQAKPQQQKAQTPQQPKAEQPKAQTPQQQKGTPQQPQQQKAVELRGGLKYTITKPGNGDECKAGQKVFVKYVGKLTKNNKVFDKAQNAPFDFVLGAGKVIQGWDMGVAGMKVGEKRQLVIPAALGYGAEGAGREIPPNSSLTFDIELVKVGNKK